MAKDVDNQKERASWASTLTEPKLADGTAISVEAFLGDWDAFAGKDMKIVLPDGKEDNTPEDKPSATTEFVLDTTKDLTAFAQGSKVDGDTEKAGTEDYFTLIYSAKSKVDGSNKTFDDGYEATQRVNFGGAITTEKNAKIEDAAAPLAAAPTLPAGYTYEQVNVSKDGILRAALLNKYYGQKVYFAAIFGKNFGMTIDMQEASAVAADLQLSYTMLNMPAFAAGFDTIHAVPNVRTKLPMSVTLHFGVGNEYTGRIAYIYVLAEDEKSYKLVTAMPVNEIGNVAIKTADFTDVMILIAK